MLSDTVHKNRYFTFYVVIFWPQTR